MISKIYIRLFVWGFLLLQIACANQVMSRGHHSNCEIEDVQMIRDVLYFGRNKPTGDTVSDKEWQNFLDQVVTPKFPEGLTVVSARGQWKGQSNLVETEESEIVILFHSANEVSFKAVAELAQEYKRRFRQEAVLRERTAVCSRFY